MTSPEPHPFLNKCDFDATFHTDFAFHDAHGRIVCAFIKSAFPAPVTLQASLLLGPAAKRTSLRASIYGGASPQSGISGYFDYFGAPVEQKCRKTAFTNDNARNWADVFPLVEYANVLYKKLCPKHWERQNAAIPDVVRIRNTVFSTLTINEKFRTAKHTDTGDFDHGLGALSVLQGNYKGLCLGFPDFGFCVDVQPTDLVFFNTHFFHCNTELEVNSKAEWSRLSCVFYFRSNLASKRCIDLYKKRQKFLQKGAKFLPEREFVSTNEKAEVYAKNLSPASLLKAYFAFRGDNFRVKQYELLEKWFAHNRHVWRDLFPEIPMRGKHCLKPSAEILHDEFTPERLTAKKVYSNEIDYLDDLSQLGIPEDIVIKWETDKKVWLSELKTADVHAKGGLTWKNSGELSKSFFTLCDTAQTVFEILTEGEETTANEKSNFNALFEAHLLRAYAEPQNGTPGHLTLDKLHTKVLDYEHGGTRYSKDLSLEEKAMRKRHPKFSIEKLKESDGELAYQTEDFPWNYEENGLLRPEEYVTSKLGDIGSVEDTFRNLHQNTVQSTNVLVISDTLLAEKMESDVLQKIETKLQQLFFKKDDPTKEAEYHRLMRCFVDQWKTQANEWKVIENVEVTEIEMNAFESHNFAKRNIDAVCIPRGFNFLSEENQISFLSQLKNLHCPVIVSAFLAEDPMQYVLKESYQESHNEAIRDAFEDITALSPECLLTNAQWNALLARNGWNLVGTFRVKGAALGDTYFIILPDE